MEQAFQHLEEIKTGPSFFTSYFFTIMPSRKIDLRETLVLKNSRLEGTRVSTSKGELSKFVSRQSFNSGNQILTT